MEPNRAVMISMGATEAPKQCRILGHVCRMRDGPAEPAITSAERWRVVGRSWRVAFVATRGGRRRSASATMPTA